LFFFSVKESDMEYIGGLTCVTQILLNLLDTNLLPLTATLRTGFVQWNLSGWRRNGRSKTNTLCILTNASSSGPYVTTAWFFAGQTALQTFYSKNSLADLFGELLAPKY
jgi:hypothetical protein